MTMPDLTPDEITARLAPLGWNNGLARGPFVWEWELAQGYPRCRLTTFASVPMAQAQLMGDLQEVARACIALGLCRPPEAP